MPQSSAAPSAVLKNCVGIPSASAVVGLLLRTAYRRNGLVAKKAVSGSGLALSDTEMRGWMPVAESIQMLICQSKLKAPQVRSCLLGTGDAYLLHQDNRAKADTPWGGKVPGLKQKLSKGGKVTSADVVGKNKLGMIWMAVRDQIAGSE
eukprot:gnl/TRDRNA2_/TRDRNA2_163762_c0_seq2.p1 gnl/TRDRNA2_/TRDRNA2_163762_c0~~gnl/TRDRNA2_/TRDRNA2_163762_c0_seq2.p1  ORF type:complete len:149 (-),score=32.39 gnl/TRDRNA2_/TRDRNA2_163762_c0_seq2:336-782(-)